MKKGILSNLILLTSIFMLSGCDRLRLLNSKGPIAERNMDFFIGSMFMMLCVVVPVIILTLLFAWYYRHSNKKAEYRPKWSDSPKLEAVIWGIPICLIVTLAVITWHETHLQDPYNPIASISTKEKPIDIQVVSLDWKWLFIYPDQGIASVNEMAAPVGRAVHFILTSDSVMNSFYVPELGSMIYTMAGMQTQLYLRADHQGNFEGFSTNYSGRGFSDMKFRFHSFTNEGFDQWVNKVRESSLALNENNYRILAAPSENNPVTYYGQVEPAMFDQIVAKYNMGMVRDRNSGKVSHIESPVFGMSMKE